MTPQEPLAGLLRTELPELFQFLLLSLFSLVLQECHALSSDHNHPHVLSRPLPPLLTQLYLLSVVVVNLSNTVCAAQTPLDG